MPPSNRHIRAAADNGYPELPNGRPLRGVQRTACFWPVTRSRDDRACQAVARSSAIERRLRLGVVRPSSHAAGRAPRTSLVRRRSWSIPGRHRRSASRLPKPNAVSNLIRSPFARSYSGHGSVSLAPLTREPGTTDGQPLRSAQRTPCVWSVRVSGARRGPCRRS